MAKRKLSLTIKYGDLKALVSEGDTIIATPKAEDALVALLTLREQVEAAIDEAKARIEEAALKLNPNFTSVRSDKVKAFYRMHGSKYAVDPSKVQFLPKEVYTTKVSYSVQAKPLEKFVKEHDGKFPDGILIKERTKSLTLSLVKPDEDGNEE